MDMGLTEVVLLVDRSGSMETTRYEAQNALNKFVEDQKGKGRCNFTLVEFDDRYEQVYSGPIENTPKYTLVPRGWTCLADSVGRLVLDTGERLLNLPEEKRAGLVILVIITDGGENSSKEFSMSQVREMLEHQQSKYSWQVQYLGSNQDAFAVAKSMGVRTSSPYSPRNTKHAFAAASNSVSRMRESYTSGGIVCPDYTEEERQLMS